MAEIPFSQIVESIVSKKPRKKKKPTTLPLIGRLGTKEFLALVHRKAGVIGTGKEFRTRAEAKNDAISREE